MDYSSFPLFTYHKIIDRQIQESIPCIAASRGWPCKVVSCQRPRATASRGWPRAAASCGCKPWATSVAALGFMDLFGIFFLSMQLLQLYMAIFRPYPIKFKLSLYVIRLLFFCFNELFKLPSYFSLYSYQVYKRLKLTLELVKKEMEISKIQVLYCKFLCLQWYSEI